MDDAGVKRHSRCEARSKEPARGLFTPLPPSQVKWPRTYTRVYRCQPTMNRIASLRADFSRSREFAIFRSRNVQTLRGRVSPSLAITIAGNALFPKTGTLTDAPIEVERSRIKKSIMPVDGHCLRLRSNSGICPMAAEPKESSVSNYSHTTRPSFGLSVSWLGACTGRLSLIPKSPEKVHHRHLLVGGSPLSTRDGRIMRNRLCLRRFVDKQNRPSFLSFRSWIVQRVASYPPPRMRDSPQRGVSFVDARPSVAIAFILRILCIL